MQLARPSSSNTALSFVWALAPLFTCGVATPFTIGYASYRRRSPALLIAASLYLLCLFVMFVLVVVYAEEQEFPDVPAILVVLGLFTTWIGGLIHSLAIRSAVFAPSAPGQGSFPPAPPQAYRAASYPPVAYPATPAPRPYPNQGPPNQHRPNPLPPVTPVPPVTPHNMPRPSGPYPHPAQSQPQDRRPAAPQDRRPQSGPYDSQPRQGQWPQHAQRPATGPGQPHQPHQPSGPNPAVPHPNSARPNSAHPSSAHPSNPRPGSSQPGGPHSGARNPADPGQAAHRRPDTPLTRHITNPIATNPSASSSGGVHSNSTLPTHTASPLAAGEPDQIGPYRLIGSLGQGGQGSVYLAETAEGTRVAIKVLHARLAAEAGSRQRFLREVEAARRVAPFSTARVIDADVSEDRLFIVSEYVEGSSLEQLVRERGPRGHDGLVRLALGTSGALAAIHKAGIVHRDFKPSNVLIGADGPRVVDFGIARVLDNATSTSSGVLGTPAYMSPEQVAGERVGPESDVFSWAATMVFAATGRPAFGEDNIAAVLHRIFTQQPDLSALPDSLAKVVERCLDKRPDNRPSASDVMLAVVQ